MKKFRVVARNSFWKTGAFITRGQVFTESEIRVRWSGLLSGWDGSLIQLNRLMNNSRWIIFEEVKEAKEVQEFTKSDLKSGDVLVRRCGWVEIVIGETLICLNTNITGDSVTSFGYNLLSDLRENISCGYEESEFDIVKVIRLGSEYLPRLLNNRSLEGLEMDLVYKRPQNNCKIEADKNIFYPR